MAGFEGIKTFQAKTKAQATAIIRRFGRQTFIVLLRRSPVKTANFRANWLASVNTPIAGDPKDRRRKKNPGIAFGTPTMVGVEISNASPLLTAKLGDTMYITNNVDYAANLEAGKSAMAPAGVLYLAAQEMAGKNA
jgi:hypothetical protein